MDDQNLFAALRAAFPADLDATAIETARASFCAVGRLVVRARNCMLSP